MPENHEIDPAVRVFGVVVVLFSLMCLALPVAVFWAAFG